MHAALGCFAETVLNHRKITLKAGVFGKGIYQSRRSGTFKEPNNTQVSSRTCLVRKPACQVLVVLVSFSVREETKDTRSETQWESCGQEQ